MATNAPPSRNPANTDSLQGLLQITLTKFLQNVDDMLPAIVLAYDRATNRAQVQPLVSMVTTLNEVVKRGQVASIPVLQLGGRGFVISFPVQVNDLGWIKANDRDISFFKKVLNFATPNTQRKHSFSDAMFIPDTMFKNVVIAPEDANNAVWQNLAGTVRLALWPDKVKVTTPSMGIGNVSGFAPHASALLDLVSTNKAFRPPTMSAAQKNAIPNPQIGFTVYDTDQDGLSCYTTGGWS